ncbi:MAG: 3-hydroxyacyl-ACP dehydratase FabZ family protein [Planctomycetota bacterium]|jgi:3-hydroxyacyl-[acyl-carrier-protein] dehydratase
MASALFFDLDSIDTHQIVYTKEQIEAVNPQRGDMQHLDGITWVNDEISLGLGFKDVTEDEFWVEGHIPGRPLLPGVIMIEAAAQFSAFLMNQRIPDIGFVGFTGCENVKFRGQVTPGQRLWLLGKEHKFGKRRMICDIQGVVDNTLVFECRVIGMPF